MTSPHEGEIEITQGLELPGKTDPDEIWREPRRRMYEAIHRPDVYQATQHGSIRTATRDDKVMASKDLLDKFQRATRVVSVVGSPVELDERISMEAEASYSIRFRVFADEEDPVGVSVGRHASAPGPSGHSRQTRPSLAYDAGAWRRTRAGALTEAKNLGAAPYILRDAGQHLNVTTTDHYARGRDESIAKVVKLRNTQ